MEKECHPRAGGEPEGTVEDWIPACAGMTRAPELVQLVPAYKMKAPKIFDQNSEEKIFWGVAKNRS